MANILDDNTVIPSYLSAAPQGRAVDPGHMTNVALRFGEVREIVYASDARNLSQRFTEYTVEVQEKDAQGPGTSTRYAGCVLLNLFGSVADILRFTLRPGDKDQATEAGVSVGAKVLVLCINGDTTKAVILGGLRDTGTDPEGSGYEGKDAKADGHNFFFEFNGIQAKINDDGELQVRFRGKTEVDGDLADSADEDAENSTLLFNKEGGVKIYTPEEKQFVFLDHKNKKIDILADDEWHVKVNKKLTFETGDQISVTGQSGCSIEVQSNVEIKSAGVKTGAATDATMMGTTFRNAQATLHQTIISLANNLNGLMTTAAGAMTTASGMMSVPITGAVAAAGPLAAAGAAMSAAAPMFTALASALTTFEAQAATYLSKKNTSD